MVRGLAIALVSLGCSAAPLADWTWEVEELYAEAVGETYTITVLLPPTYDETREYALALGLDDGAPSLAIGLGELERKTGFDPQTIAVSPMSEGGYSMRSRDYYPPRLDGSAPRCLDEKPCGEADRFFAFVVDELVPWLEDRYPLRRDPTARLIHGHSGGGTGAMYALLAHDDTFGRILAGSPWLRHDNLLLYDYEHAAWASGEPLTGRVYLGIGGDEVHYRVEVGPFVKALRGRDYADLALRYDIHPGLDHTAAYTPAIDAGLRFLYGVPE